MKIFTTILAIFLITAGLYARVSIPLNHPGISYDGIWFARVSAERVVLNRHTEDVLINPGSGISAGSKPYAYTQSGVRIRFRTSSPTVRVSFEENPAGGRVGLKNGFAVYAAGRRIAVHDSLSFIIASPEKNISIEYEVLLPSMHSVDFTGMSLDDGYDLDPVLPLNKPVYAAIGNSITHGNGQQSASYLTFPYILSQLMGWDLHNLAVGGAHTGWSVAQLLKNRRVDYITVEFGFNDWMWDTKSLEEKAATYNKLLDTLRAYLKTASIFCITPPTTTYTVAKLAVPFTLEQYREMVRNTVEQRRKNGDMHLYVINGDAITDSTMLKDGVHLNIEGADKFAHSLRREIIKMTGKK
ncbi:MAG: SGNH/GDSL hydrolase family protein [Bacteroidota bacterium]